LVFFAHHAVHKEKNTVCGTCYTERIQSTK